MAQACERAGFDAFWLAEAYPWWRKHGMEARSSTAIASIIARETKRFPSAGASFRLTPAILCRSPWKRALCRTLPERAFLLGLGASKIFMKEVGEGESGQNGWPGHRNEGKHRNYSRRAGRRAVRLRGPGFRRARARASKGAHTARDFRRSILALPGRFCSACPAVIADGFLTASITTPEFVRYSRTMMEEGAATSW